MTLLRLTSICPLFVADEPPLVGLDVTRAVDEAIGRALRVHRSWLWAVKGRDN